MGRHEGEPRFESEVSVDCKEIIFASQTNENMNMKGSDFTIIRTEDVQNKNFLNIVKFGKQSEHVERLVLEKKLAEDLNEQYKRLSQAKEPSVLGEILYRVSEKEFFQAYGYDHFKSEVNIEPHQNFINSRKSLTAYGYPLGGDLTVSKLKVNFSSFVSGVVEETKHLIYELRGFSAPGMSGSTILDKQCRIVGVLFGGKASGHELDPLSGFRYDYKKNCYYADVNHYSYITPSEPILKVLSLIQENKLVVADSFKTVFDRKRYSNSEVNIWGN